MDEILTAVNDYILKFVKPVAVQDIIYCGYQNRMALPPNSQDFIIINWSGGKRIGTNVTDMSASAAGVLSTGSLNEHIVDIDFCNINNAVASERAGTLSTLGRSFYSVDFFREYGISFLYADDIRFLPYVDEFKQYIYRYRITLHLTKWNTVQIGQEYFERAEINRIENVDIHHKPNNKARRM